VRRSARGTLKRTLIAAVLAAAALFVAAAAREVAGVEKAHSTFENYYAFRGCEQLLTRTADAATCRLGSGNTITIVRFRGRWYLDGDLPFCLGRYCL
jgi:hypothetical protein